MYVINRPHYAVLVDDWFSKVNLWIETQGPNYTVKRIKSMRLHVTRYLCGEPLNTPALTGMGLNSKGLPRGLGSLQSLLSEGDEWDTRFLLTLLSISRAIPCTGKVDMQTITKEGKPTSRQTIDEFLLALHAKQWHISRSSLT